MKKHLSLLVFSAALLMVVGAACTKTTTNSTTNTNAAADLANLPINVVRSYPYDVMVKIDKKDGSAATQYSSTITEDTTALALLQKLSTEKGLKLETKDYEGLGTLITGIDGVSQTSSKYWTFYINNTMAPVGAGEYKVQQNDTIEFRFEAGQ